MPVDVGNALSVSFPRPALVIRSLACEASGVPDPGLESSFFQRVTLAAKLEISAVEEALSVDPLLNAVTLELLSVRLAIANAAPTNAPQPTTIMTPAAIFSRPILIRHLFSNSEVQSRALPITMMGGLSGKPNRGLCHRNYRISLVRHESRPRNSATDLDVLYWCRIALTHTWWGAANYRYPWCNTLVPNPKYPYWRKHR